MSSDGPRRELTHTYAPGPDVVVPDLAGLPGAARSDYPLTVELTTTYVDTEDLALARAGVRLSVLTGGDEGWLLVLPWTGRDSVVRAPLGPNPAEVPAALRDLVQGWVRDRDLVEAGRVEVARTGRDVLDRDDAVVARLVDDVATGTVDGQDPLGWRRWSLRSTQAAVLAAADRLMSDAGVPPDDAIDDVARLLGDRLPGRDDPDHLGRRVPVKRVVGARLREQHAALLRADLEMRRGNEHGVHQARVALRRLRSALATFRPAMERTASEQLREELGWLSRALGAARDRHVVRGRLVALATGEDELAGPVLERIRSASWTSDSDTSVAEVLSSPRCFALLGSLDEFVGSPPWTDRADRKAGRYLQRRVAKEWARVADRVAPVADLDPGTAPDEALHEIRKAAKRLRYALETAELVWPRKPKRLRKRVRDLTELLGERQDTVVTRSALLELAAEADAAGEPTFTHGRLDRIEELHAAELEERFHRAWSAAVDQRTDWP